MKCSSCKKTLRSNYIEKVFESGKYRHRYHVKCYTTKILSELLDKTSLIKLLGELD